MRGLGFRGSAFKGFRGLGVWVLLRFLNNWGLTGGFVKVRRAGGRGAYAASGLFGLPWSGFR